MEEKCTVTNFACVNYCENTLVVQLKVCFASNLHISVSLSHHEYQKQNKKSFPSLCHLFFWLLPKYEKEAVRQLRHTGDSVFRNQSMKTCFICLTCSLNRTMACMTSDMWLWRGQINTGTVSKLHLMKHRDTKVCLLMGIYNFVGEMLSLYGILQIVRPLLPLSCVYVC